MSPNFQRETDMNHIAYLFSEALVTHEHSIV